MPGHGRRTRLSQEPAWADLPKHIVVLFMRKTLTDGRPNSKCHRALQSVCKAWREAFTDFSADIDTATVALQNADDLFEVCKMLPGLCSLKIGVSIANLDALFLHPLSACSRLTNLSMSDDVTFEGAPKIDLLLLPSALKHLKIEILKMDPRVYDRIEFTRLTSLVLLPYDTLQATCALRLLRRLPSLEALHIGQAFNDYMGRQYHDHLEVYLGLPTLTSLKLQEGTLWPILEPVQCTALQKLELFRLYTQKSVMQDLFSLLSMLSQLALDDCILEESDEEEENIDLDPVSTLRSLRLHKMPPLCIQLAHIQLPSLSCRSQDDGEPDNDVPDVLAIAKLTALTRLELADYCGTAKCSALHILALKELVLLRCPELVEALLVPGAFRGLEKLHIAELDWTEELSAYRANLQNPLSEGYIAAHRLHRMAAVVLSLPKLIQLSGNCRLFALAMAEELEQWHRSEYKLLSMSEYDWPAGKFVWRSPSAEH